MPALKALATNEFSNLLSSQIKKETITVVFIEPKLQTEDLTCRTADQVTHVTQSCFANLNKIQEKSYLPRVSLPVEGIYELNGDATEVVQADEVLAVAGKGKVIIVNFEAATSADDYVSHDRIIGEIYHQLAEKYTDIVVVYTGRQSEDLPKLRQKRAINKDVDWQLVKDQHFAIAAEKVLKKVDDAQAEESAITSVVSTLNGNNLDVVVQSADALTLSFANTNGNWELKGASVGGQKINRYPRFLFAAENTAMRCGEGLSFSIDKTTYTILNSQFLPVFTPNPNLAFDSDRVVHCNGYWTPGILSGLFVVFLLLIIMAWGLTFIMDINTMDKFDDPKGKTITINAAD